MEKKEIYESLNMDIVTFENVDIITDSTVPLDP